MQELEALLTSYLSRNWHRMDDVLDANELDLREDGLVCLPDAARRASVSHASSSVSLSARSGASPLASSDSAESEGSGMSAAVAAPLRRLFSDVRARKATAAAKRARRNWQRAFQVRVGPTTAARRAARSCCSAHARRRVLCRRTSSASRSRRCGPSASSRQ